MTASSEEWAGIAKRHLKAELRHADVSYAELARRLTEMGLPERVGSISAKLNRGTFPAWFLLAVMSAIGAETFRLHESASTRTRKARAR